MDSKFEIGKIGTRNIFSASASLARPEFGRPRASGDGLASRVRILDNSAIDIYIISCRYLWSLVLKKIRKTYVKNARKISCFSTLISLYLRI